MSSCRELVLAQLGQFLAQVTQLVHLLLDLGLARRQLFLFLRNRLVAQTAPPGVDVIRLARMRTDDFYLAVIVFLGIMWLYIMPFAVAMFILTFVITKMDVQRFVFFAVFFVLVHNCDVLGLDEPTL